MSMNVFLFGQINPGQIGSNQEICYGSAPLALSFIIQPTSGTLPYTYRWQRSNDNSNWYDIEGNTASLIKYSPPVLGRTAWFRCKVTDASNMSATTDAVTISVSSDLAAGIIGDAQEICSGDPVAELKELQPASGGVGDYTYQWHTSSDGLRWSIIQGATDDIYSPTLLNTDTWYRRQVIDRVCGSTASNAIKITVNNPTLAQLQSDPVYFTNSNIEFRIIIEGGSPPYTIMLERNGVSMTSVDDYLSNTPISAGLLPIGTYTYHLVSVTDSKGCMAQNLGDDISITVNPITIYTSETPVDANNDSRYDLGTEFSAKTDGFITHVRLFSYLEEEGIHDVRIWAETNDSEYELVFGPTEWNFSAGINGWRNYELTSPVAVEANRKYIVSVTNSADNNWYVQSDDYFEPLIGDNPFLTYYSGRYAEYPYEGYPYWMIWHDASYFRDVVFSPFFAGSIGNPQSICYNNRPSNLIQLSAPSGGDGEYEYQWQLSTDNSIWSNIEGARNPEYEPPQLYESTYFRRLVSSNGTISTSSEVLITVSPQFVQAQLYEDKTIFNNTVTPFHIILSGGLGPYTINYNRDGVPQPTLENYYSADDIWSGLLTTGDYVYTLTSVMDSNGCIPESLGNSITITVEDGSPDVIPNKALVIINPESSFYSDFDNYIKPYLDNFGIPYDIYNQPNTETLPELSHYALIIFGHKNVYDGEEITYPVLRLELALNAGVGLYSFDPHLFDCAIESFSTSIDQPEVTASFFTIENTTHFITQGHSDDEFNLPIEENADLNSNNYQIITLNSEMHLNQSTSLLDGTSLLTMAEENSMNSLLEISDLGEGRIVKWNSYEWISENILGPVYGMDDLIWRGMVWAARKPFVIQGLPPMITMRVDDVFGVGNEVVDNFEWINIANDFGLIPWCGTFNSNIPEDYIPTFKALLDEGMTTASPHAFDANDFIYLSFASDFRPLA